MVYRLQDAICYAGIVRAEPMQSKVDSQNPYRSVPARNMILGIATVVEDVIIDRIVRRRVVCSVSPLNFDDSIESTAQILSRN